MNFTREVCEHFFDFSRDLNRSNEIISLIYSIMLREKDHHRDVFDGLEKRLARTSNHCIKPDDFVKLTNTAFRNLVVPFNAECQSMYLALFFFISEWIYDQARLCVSGVGVEEIKNAMISLMTKKLKDEFRLETRAEWYQKITTISNEIETTNKDEIYEYYTAFLFGMGLSFLLSKL